MKRTLVPVLVGLLLLTVFADWLLRRSAPEPQPAHIRVEFIALTNNPVAQMTPTRLAVTPGATGLCAILWITNTSPSEYQWFKSVAVEHRTDAGWQRFAPHTSVGGSVWSPRYGCFFAVGWPPGLSTNSHWRLRMVSGPEPSPSRQWINRKIGWNLFRSPAHETPFVSSEIPPW